MSNDVINKNNENLEITKKDINRTFFRWITMAQTAWNYERMQGMGYAYAMLPFLKKRYKDKEQLKEMVKLHLQFFNTNVVTANFVLGADMAIEDERGYESKELLPAIKTGLMGPLAGVGDTLFSVTVNTVFGSIATYMALEGNPIGCIIWLLASAVKLFFANKFIHLAYKEGKKIVSSISGKMKMITDASTVMGLMVVGALIPSVIKTTIPYVYVNGETEIVFQKFLNDIMPGLLPVAIVAFTYWLLGRKNMNSTKAIFILIALSIVCFNLKIFG